MPFPIPQLRRQAFRYVPSLVGAGPRRPGRTRPSTTPATATAAALLLAVLGLAAGAAGAYTLNHREVDFRHPPGQRVDIGGYRLHLYCRGQGSPTVVFDSGIGGFSLEWIDVQAALMPYTRVCVYDRAGYGWSDRSPYPRTTNVMVQELHRLLRAAEVAPPYLLVGHSFGGYNIRYFAGEFPREVAGLVLVDASHPQQFSRFPKAAQDRKEDHAGSAPGTRIVRSVFPASYPPGVRQLAFMLMVRRHSALVQLQELEHFQESARQVLARHDRFPKLPVTILSRGRRVWPHNRHGDVMERIWKSLQHDLLSLSDRSEQLVAARSGHAIHLDQPRLVIGAILKDIQTARWDAARPNLVMGALPATPAPALIP